MISPSGTDIANLGELLAFYAEAGVDDALEEEAIDRFAQPVASPRPNEGGAVSARKERSPAGAEQEEAQWRQPEFRPTADDAVRQRPIAAIPDERQAALARE